MKVAINGSEVDIRSDTVAGVVEELQLPGLLLLIEHNGSALRKSEWSETALREGDRLEVLRVSAGG